jgi:predicted transcriptional regulator
MPPETTLPAPSPEPTLVISEITLPTPRLQNDSSPVLAHPDSLPALPGTLPVFEADSLQVSTSDTAPEVIPVSTPNSPTLPPVYDAASRARAKVSLAHKKEARLTHIVDYIREHGPASIAHLSERLRFSKSSVQSYIKTLLSRGTLIKVIDENNTRYALA